MPDLQEVRRLCFENLDAVLRSSGFGLKKAVRPVGRGSWPGGFGRTRFGWRRWLPGAPGVAVGRNKAQDIEHMIEYADNGLSDFSDGMTTSSPSVTACFELRENLSPRGLAAGA